MKNKEELKKVNEVREYTDEKLAQVTGGRSLTPSMNTFGGNVCPYCQY